jgi:hypothetical protein
MEEAWDLYRQEREETLAKLILHRSHLYRLLKARLGNSSRKLAPTADAPFAGTNAVPASRILQDHDFVAAHVAAYLSNWEKLVELSTAYHYRPVCVLHPAGGFDPSYSLPYLQQTFRLDRPTALEWIRAFGVLYDEAGRQIVDLRRAHLSGSGAVSATAAAILLGHGSRLRRGQHDPGGKGLPGNQALDRALGRELERQGVGKTAGASA